MSSWAVTKTTTRKNDQRANKIRFVGSYSPHGRRPEVSERPIHHFVPVSDEVPWWLEIENLKRERDEAREQLAKWQQMAIEADKRFVEVVRELQAKRALADRLREIFPKILNALDNGSGCTPEVSLEFLQGIPKEVELVVKHLKYENSYSEKERIDIAKELESEKKMHAETQNKLDGALEQIIHLQPKMNNKQINTAIAEACGWKWHDHPDCMAKKEGWSMPEKWIMRPDGTFTFRHDIPDYCNDLNAMHEAELSLKFDYYKFTRRLAMVCERDRRCIESAPAYQRAEAFLRAIGKWEGGSQ